MTTMARAPALSPFITGEPIRLGPDVASVADIVKCLELSVTEAPGLLAVAPGVVLLHSLTGEGNGIALRWFELPHAPRLGPAGEPVELALLLTAPTAQSGLAPRLASRLMACLRDPAWIELLRSAATREAVVSRLSAVEARLARVGDPLRERRLRPLPGRLEDLPEPGSRRGALREASRLDPHMDQDQLRAEGPSQPLGGGPGFLRAGGEGGRHDDAVGERALVHAEAGRGEELAVGRHLVAFLDSHHVAADEVGRRYPALGAVPQHG